MNYFRLILVAFVLIFSVKSAGQISVNVNIGAPPMWAPAGYDSEPFYYLPDIEAYYDVRQSQFIYFSGGNWIHARYLPEAYRNYDLYNGYKVVLTDYRGDRPYMYFKDHKQKYCKGYKGAPQRTIGMRGGKPRWSGNSGNQGDYENLRNHGGYQNNHGGESYGGERQSNGNNGNGGGHGGGVNEKGGHSNGGGGRK